jgi:DNA-binding CsgD family transcriptional regulator
MTMLRTPRLPTLSPVIFGAELLERLATGVILLDRAGRLLHANVAAHEIASAGRGLALLGGALSAANRRDRDALAARVTEALEAPTGRTFTMAIGAGAERPPLRVTIATLGRVAGGQRRLRGAAAVAFVMDLARSPADAPDLLRTLFGLTRMQARLTSRLAAGVGLAEAAGGLGISRATARSYLKQVFRRTHTRRQGELVSLVLRAFGALREHST